MNFGLYGIIIIFALFFIILMVNPKISCFGKKIKSPFYPLLRKKKKKKKETKTQDYGFKLVDGEVKQHSKKKKHPKANLEKVEDYGLNLNDDNEKNLAENKKNKGKRDS